MNVFNPRTRNQAAGTREELETLATEYRHVLAEHRRAHPGSSRRRHFEQRLGALSERFERVLSHTDGDTRARWRTHLHHGTPAPHEPAAGTGPSNAIDPPGPGEAAESVSPVEIVTRGPVETGARERLRTELARIVESSPRPVLFARGTLSHDENPSVARPARVSATVDLGHRVIRARATAVGTREATDLVIGRLKRALRELRDRDETTRRRAGHVSRL